MPLIYGSHTTPPGLGADEVGNLVTKSSSNLGWLSILLNVIEVGGSLFLGPEFGTALALVNAGAQTGINYAETGEVDALGAGLNFGAAIIPGAISSIKGAITGGKIATNLQKAGGFLEQLGKDTAKDVTGLETRLGKLMDTASTNPKITGSIGSKTQDFLQSTASRGGYAVDRVQQQVLNKKTLSSFIGKLQDASKISQKEFKQLIDVSGMVGKGGSTNRLIRNFNLAGKGLSGAGEVATDTGSDIENRIFSTVTEETGLTITEIRALKNIIEDGKILNAKLFRSILTKAYLRTGNTLLELAIAGTKQGKFLKLLTRTETTAMKLSRISSKSIAWTTKIGGYISSPSSLAADVISKTVAKLTSKVEEVGEMIAEKLGKWIKAGKKGLDALQDEFERTGGTLMKSSWLMGYKVLQESETFVTILIQFKNTHPNVITKLSTNKLLTFIEAPSKGRWYINNVARSRGGRKVSELGIEGKLENLLGMLPISKINEIIGFASFSKGFVSQIRANSGTMIWHSGAYIEGFKQGVIQGIISEGIKGAVALGTQNQYAKQVLEGGFGAVSSGTNFGVAFSSSFNSGAQSMKDTIFEDTTKAGNVVKNVKVIQGTGSSLKGFM